MSCTCPVHGLGTNQETTEALQQGLTYFGSCPYDLLQCCPSGQCPQPSMNSMFDSFGTTSLPANAWAGSEQNDQTTYLAGDPEYLMLQQVQPAIEDQNAVTKPSTGDEEVKLQDLQDRMERLEMNLGNLRNEWEEEKKRLCAEIEASMEKLCAEIEANMEKLKDWTTEVKEMVSSLVGELKGHSKSK